MIRKLHTTLIILILALFWGCTPFSENVAKRAQMDPGAPGKVIGPSTPVNSTGSSSLMDPSTASIVRSYGPTITKYSEKYGVDWRLVLAVIRVESGFSTEAESERGAAGLMQMMPFTSEEVGRHLALDDMTFPKNNIHGGIYYLSKLYNLFDACQPSDRMRLTLAAYNAGIGRIYDAQELAAYYHDNPTKWQAIRDALPLLSKRYYTLHRNVWSQDRPKSAGWFGNSKQTVAYVDRVMNYYDRYQSTLN
jgi:membrane-bound lytic murein transglycosylase F